MIFCALHFRLVICVIIEARSRKIKHLTPVQQAIARCLLPLTNASNVIMVFCALHFRLVICVIIGETVSKRSCLSTATHAVLRLSQTMAFFVCMVCSACSALQDFHVHHHWTNMPSFPPCLHVPRQHRTSCFRQMPRMSSWSSLCFAHQARHLCHH